MMNMPNMSNINIIYIYILLVRGITGMVFENWGAVLPVCGI